jgi:hypothetical protein
MDAAVLRQVLSILLVFLLLGVALRRLRGRRSLLGVPWRNTSGSAHVLQTVDRIVLTPQHMLHLVRAQGREVLVATHPQGCTVLVETASGATQALSSNPQKVGA